MVKVNFGYKLVDGVSKQGLVNDVFSSVAPKYDLMNDIMSLGMHRLWKRMLVDNISVKPDALVLDMASGTGDIAMRIYRRFRFYGQSCHITLADINQDMLDLARRRIIDSNYSPKAFDFYNSDGEASALPDNHFDYYTIAYGMRNFTDLNKALRDAHLKLKHGGKFLCLEFSAVPQGLLKTAYDFYSFNIIPKVGQMVTGDKESYQYFVESIRMFPKPAEFRQMIEDSGFVKVRLRNLSFGITTIYIGEKP